MNYSGNQLRRFALLLIVVLLNTFVLMHDPTISLSRTSTIPARGDANEKNRSAQVLPRRYELAAPDETTRLRVTEAYGNLPLQFEANNGQSDARVEFISRGSGYTMFLTSDEAALSLHATSKANTGRADSSPQTLRMKLVGANPEPQITPLEQLPGRVNHFVGNDPTKWHEQISTYRRVKFESVYPGVDLIYYGNQRQLEHDFIVTPGADPKTIRLLVSGSRDIRIDNVTGDLLLRVGDKEVRQLKPIVYQELNGARREVSGNYSITGKSEFGFEIGAYDASRPLVIDPVLVYSSPLGGSGSEGGNAIAVDASGNAYVTGNTTSINFPTFNAIQPARNGADDVFISKINPAGTALVYSTYLGGSTGFEHGFDIAVDTAGNAYVAGRTIAADFPTTANAFQVTKLTGPSQDTAFVTRLNSAGALFYSTYLSGTQSSKAWGIATDGAGNAYVTGQAGLGFPVTPSAFQANGSGNVFVSKLNTNGSGATSLVYSTLLGVSAEGRAIAADSTGNVYVTGTTLSLSFPVRNAFQPSHAGGLQDAFVAKLNTNLFGDASLIYSTFLGGGAADFGGGAGNFDSGKAIAIDVAGNAYVTGQTASTNFPTANAFQPANAGFTDAFLTKLNPTGSGLVYSTYLGGTSFSNGDSGRSVAVNALGNAYVTGRTQSPDFPSVAFIANTGGVFLTKFTPFGNALVYSTRGIVSGVAEAGTGVALDNAGNAFVTGANSGDAFVTEIADPTIIGRVVDENGNPIASVPVNLTGVPSATTTTDVNGYFTFGLLTFANNYTVSVSVATYTFNSQVVNNLRKNVRLDFSPVVFTISGQVTNAGSGLSGVTVALSGGKSLTTLTNASGNYSFSNLPAGRDYTVTPSHASFTFVPTSRSFLNLSANQTADFAPPQWQPVVLTAQQIVELKAWTVGGRTYVYVKPQFPDAGFRVVDWGQVVRSGSEFTVDASVEKFTGPSIQAVVTTAQIYDLGPLAFGIYNFIFKTSGTLAKTLQFTVSSAIPQPNPIDNAREFVRQQYRDFLNREADPAGENFWTDNITKCSDPANRPAGQTEAQCTLRQRETTSGAFLLSPEFQYTGYFVYRMYQGALGRQPKLSEFTPDVQFVAAGIVANGQLSAAKINQNKADFAAQFVDCTDAAKSRCAEFKAIYDGLNNQQYVDKLFQTTGVNASAADRTALVDGLNGGTETRATVLQKVVDGVVVIAEGNQQFTTTYGQAFYNAEFNRAFVLMEYFGYMKRDPDDAGYAFWLAKLNQFGGNFVNAELVLAFISSPEYRSRFGQP